MDVARAADAAAAAVDDAASVVDAADEGDGDQSVCEVDAARPAPRFTSPTPPPASASEPRLIEVIAARTAHGEPPGIDDEDHLMEGQKESDVEQSCNCGMN